VARYAGAAGTYHFNLYAPIEIRNAMLNQPEDLAGKDKVYYASNYGYSPERYLADSHHLLNLPQISPRSLNAVTASGLRLPLEMGEDVEAEIAAGRRPRVRAYLIIGNGEQFAIDLAVNGKEQAFLGKNRHMHVYDVRPEDLRLGANRFVMKLEEQGRSVSMRMPAAISDFAVTVDYPKGGDNCPREVGTWNHVYPADASQWRRAGAKRTADGLRLAYREGASSYLAAPSPGAEQMAASSCLVAETELELESGAVAIALSNGRQFTAYLVEEFGGSIAFWSSADGRRPLLTNRPHRYRIETFAGTGRVHVDDFLYSDINLPLQLMDMSKAHRLFDEEERDLFRKGGLLIKALSPRHGMLNNKPYQSSGAKVLSARIAY